MFLRIIENMRNLSDSLMQAMQDDVPAMVAMPSPHLDIHLRMADQYAGEPALLTWTSGTTAEPKGVLIPWKAVRARCESLHRHYAAHGLLPIFEGGVYSYLPCNNSGGIITSRLSTVLYGLPFEEENPEQASVIVATPHIFSKLVEKDFRSDRLRLIIVNGQPLEPETRLQIENHFRVPVLDLYGSSETGAAAIEGEILDGYDVRITDGRIAIQSRGMASGYLNDALPFPLNDGWFQTQDAAAMADNRLSGIRRV